MRSALVEPFQILIADGADDDAGAIADILRASDLPVAIHRARDREDLATVLASQPFWSCIVCDAAFGGGDFGAVMKHFGTASAAGPVIVTDTAADASRAAWFMDRGACDYVRKTDLTRLLPAVRRELNRTRINQPKPGFDQGDGFLSAVLDNISDGIVACDAEGNLSVFNKATRAFHGLPETDIPASEWADYYDLYLPDGKSPMTMEQIPLIRALNGEDVRDVEMVIAPKGRAGYSRRGRPSAMREMKRLAPSAPCATSRIKCGSNGN